LFARGGGRFGEEREGGWASTINGTVHIVGGPVSYGKEEVIGGEKFKGLKESIFVKGAYVWDEAWDRERRG